MYPVLFKINGVAIYTSGLFTAIGFFFSIYLLKKETDRSGIKYEHMLELCFWGLIAGIIGSRIFYFPVFPGHFLTQPMEIFRVWNGGFVFFGALLTGMAAGGIYIKKNRLPLWKSADIMPLPIASCQFFISIGSYLTGDSFGKVCGYPWAVIFVFPDSLAPTGIPLHPTQIYMAAGMVAIFGGLLIIKDYKKFDGQIFLSYLVLYGILRTIVDFYRDDRGPSLFGGLFSFLQLTGVCMAAWAAIMIVSLWQAKEKQDVKNNTSGI